MVDWAQNTKLFTEIFKIAIYTKRFSDYIQISQKQKLKLTGICAKICFDQDDQDDKEAGQEQFSQYVWTQGQI